MNIYHNLIILLFLANVEVAISCELNCDLQKDNVEVLTPRTCECDLIWK